MVRNLAFFLKERYGLYALLKITSNNLPSDESKVFIHGGLLEPYLMVFTNKVI